MNRILSGIQPTAAMHLGNYLGAVRNWVGLQDSFETLYCVVDLHALTLPQNPAELRENSRTLAATLMAAGIDPRRSILFVQSSVPAHSELAWLFSCLTPLGWLNRMTQFKEKAGKHKEQAVLGLYSYPVLMAADILIYRATHVPVGEDQKQHLELTREIAGAFNYRYGREYFPLPEPQIFGSATRVMSLRDGTKKMSKSDSSDFSRINMTDDADTIALKIRKAKTDPLPLPAAPEDLEARPEADNLVHIYAALTHKPVAEVLAEFNEAPFSTFKSALTDIAVTALAPIAEEMRRLLADPGYVDGVLHEGGGKARAIADATLREVKEIMGILTPAGP
ncbi:MAG: tryptophan--tRNA ligase [Alphaproteobacteria bacterium]|jgi:tryptophanyl-tRNA synthetase|nr:tryptophan--tRNA ligase [Alphaproteobacteria bacterium]